ncbi:MAG: hypothetical protein QGF00_22590 [Planctomycetota bacterium]|jgi:hypothetical protein|nr:hypothetical protein [Planctomycetota bacterium]MDP7252416.1 hypothetical protein [Planctomycetota bacterium]
MSKVPKVKAGEVGMARVDGMLDTGYWMLDAGRAAAIETPADSWNE